MECFCAVCDCITEVELIEEGVVMCLACGDEFEKVEKAASSIYDHYVIGLVLNVEPIAGKDLKKVMVDTTGKGEASAVQIVTNAKYVEANWKVVVACEQAIVPAGGEVDDGVSVVVKKSSVGGVMSHGMLCDAPMLKWTGGAKGKIQQMPDESEVGQVPPDTRPRG